MNQPKIRFHEARSELTDRFKEIKKNPRLSDDIPEYVAEVKRIMKSNAGANVEAALEALLDTLPPDMTEAIQIREIKEVSSALDLIWVKWGPATKEEDHRYANRFNNLRQEEGELIADFLNVYEIAWFKKTGKKIDSQDGQDELKILLKSKVLPKYRKKMEIWEGAGKQYDYENLSRKLRDIEATFTHFAGDQNRSEENPNQFQGMANSLSTRGREYQSHQRKLNDDKKENPQKEDPDIMWCWGCGQQHEHKTRTCDYIARQREKRQKKGKHKHYCVIHLGNKYHGSVDCDTLKFRRLERQREKLGLAEIPKWVIDKEKDQQDKRNKNKER